MLCYYVDFLYVWYTFPFISLLKAYQIRKQLQVGVENSEYYIRMLI